MWISNGNVHVLGQSDVKEKTASKLFQIFSRNKTITWLFISVFIHVLTVQNIWQSRPETKLRFTYYLGKILIGLVLGLLVFEMKAQK